MLICEFQTCVSLLASWKHTPLYENIRTSEKCLGNIRELNFITNVHMFSIEIWVPLVKKLQPEKKCARPPPPFKQFRIYSRIWEHFWSLLPTLPFRVDCVLSMSLRNELTNSPKASHLPLLKKKRIIPNTVLPSPDKNQHVRSSTLFRSNIVCPKLSDSCSLKTHNDLWREWIEMKQQAKKQLQYQLKLNPIETYLNIKWFATSTLFTYCNEVELFF